MTEAVTWFEAVILGIVQGMTEFLPISSTAHILIVSQIFGWKDPGAAFSAVTQIGTEIAVLVYFRSDIARILQTWFTSLRDTSLRSHMDARMGWYIIIGTIPISLLGLVFSDQIETAARNLWLVASMLIVFGVVLGVADALGSRKHDLTELNRRDGLLFGIGHDGHHGLTHKAHAPEGQRAAGRGGCGFSVRTHKVGQGGHVFQAGCAPLRAGQHQVHARHGLCGGGVNRANVGVRVGRAQKSQSALRIEHHIVGILAVASQQLFVFQTAHGLTAAKTQVGGVHGGSSLGCRVGAKRAV